LSATILALDFGGTKHAAAIAAPGERQWRAVRRAPAPPGADANSDIRTMIALARELLSSASPLAVGVSFGGPVDTERGVVRLSHHVPGWEGVSLPRILEQEFGVRAAVDNDANVAALGEYRFGAGQGCRSLLYITVSTGVGGGWVLDGRIWHGADGMAGEIGHTTVDPNGPLCPCGKKGCLESLAAGPFVARAAQEQLTEHPGEGRLLLDLAGGKIEEVTPKLISDAAEGGDDLSRRVLDAAAQALGRAIGNAANLVNPDLVVLGGGMMNSGDRFWKEIRRVSCETALPQLRVEVVPAALGNEAPLWGGVALAEEILGLAS
jgi:glucokinase